VGLLPLPRLQRFNGAGEDGGLFLLKGVDFAQVFRAYGLEFIG
jgi:hypothetical protein